MADHRFEVNKLYNDNSDAYIVVNRSADYISFRHVATNKVSRRKAKTTYVRGDKYETVTLKNIYGSTIHLLSNGVLSECVDMIIANAKAAYNEAMAEQQETTAPQAQQETTQTTEQATEQQAQPELSRETLEELCRNAYDCSNPEDMRSLLDTLSTDTLAGMCRLVNATNSSSPTKAECIDAFIAAAMEHKTMKAAREAQASASTPATFTINPEVKPDYDAAFDEYAYSPACQFNRAIFDDERESRMFRPIKRRPATTGRRFPTPKNPRGSVSDFSLCKDPEKLRKMLNAGSIDVVKSIAESFNEFQPRTDGKPMTKSDYVTAIVRLYFPNYQPAKKAPVQETPQVNYPFVPGKIYIKAKYRTTREIELIKVIRRKGDYITVQEVSYPELVPMFKTQRVKVQHDRFLTQEGFMLNSHDTTDINHIPQDCVYSLPEYEYNPEYYQPKPSQPSTPIFNADELHEILSIPTHDMEYDECAYSPDVQEVSVIVDDIPADHEPDVQEVKTVQPAKFIIGRHYQSRGLDKGTVTFLGKTGPQYGYFVDSINRYYRVKIKTDSTGEYTSISHKSRAFPANRISADHEVLEHEIISVANGTSIVLNAENVIHSYEELEAKLAPQPATTASVQEVNQETSAPSNPEHQPVPVEVWGEADCVILCTHIAYLPILEKILRPQFSNSQTSQFIRTINNYWAEVQKEISQLTPVQIEAFRIIEDININYIPPEHWQAMLKGEATCPVWMYIRNCVGSRLRNQSAWGNSTSGRIYNVLRNLPVITKRLNSAHAPSEPAPSSKSAHKPATRKPRHAKKTDTSRQILIPFDDEERPDPTSEPAKLKAKRRPRMPRVKTDYSRQILIDFGEDIPSSQTNQRQAA